VKTKEIMFGGWKSVIKLIKFILLKDLKLCLIFVNKKLILNLVKQEILWHNKNVQLLKIWNKDLEFSAKELDLMLNNSSKIGIDLEKIKLQETKFPQNNSVKYLLMLISQLLMMNIKL